MIQTEKHGKIEPRAGDVFKDTDDGEQYTIERIDYENEGIEIWWCDSALIEVAPEDDCYILLHRPFQVGDEVIVGDVGAHGYSEWSDIWEEPYHSAFIVKHVNPAWRDHSEWEPANDKR